MASRTSKPPKRGLPSVQDHQDTLGQLHWLADTESVLPPAPEDRIVVDLDLADVSFLAQPREIIPETLLDDLVAAGAASPATVLAELQRLAGTGAEPWFGILADLESMAESIRPPGRVLVPVFFFVEDDKNIVVDGHRRCLASVLAGRAVVPALPLVGQTEWAREMDRLTLEDKHVSWKPIERARALNRAWLAIQEALRGKTLANLSEMLTVADLEALQPEVRSCNVATTEGDSPGESGCLDGPLTDDRLLRGIARRIIERRQGMTKDVFYRWLRLLQLAPAAQELAQAGTLSRSHLLPVTQLDAASQMACLQAIIEADLGVRQVERLVKAVGDGADPHEEAARLAGRKTGAKARAAAGSPQQQPPSCLTPASRPWWKRTRRQVDLLAKPDMRIEALKTAAETFTSEERGALAENLKVVQAWVSRALAAIQEPK